MASDKDLFDICFNFHQEENKDLSKEKKTKKKLTKRYMEIPNKTKKEKLPNKTGLICDDEFVNTDENENIEKINKTKQLIKENANKFKYTNQIIGELNKVISTDEVNKLIVSMADKNEENELKDKKCEIEIDEEAENLLYDQLNERIKKQIREKGTYDFSKLSKEDRELLLKKKIYSNTDNVKLLKEKKKRRPLTSQVKMKKKDEEITIDPKKKKRQKFTHEPDQPYNNCTDYIPKPAMNGFLLRAYKNKAKDNKGDSGIIESANDRYMKFKAKPMPNFKFQKDTKKIAHPLLADFGKI